MSYVVDASSGNRVVHLPVGEPGMSFIVNTDDFGMAYPTYVYAARGERISPLAVGESICMNINFMSLRFQWVIFKDHSYWDIQTSFGGPFKGIL